MQQHPLLHLPVRVPHSVIAEVVTDVGRRLSTAATLARAIEVSPCQTGFPDAVRWWAPSLAQGNAGLAVLFGVLDTAYPGQGWDRGGHEHLSVAVHTAQRQRLTVSLFCGFAGLGYAAFCLSRGGERYGRLLASIDETVAGQTRVLIERIRDGRSGRAVSEFDLISGLSGVGAYLLTRGSPLVPALLRALAEMIVRRQDPPAWHTPVDRLETAEQRERYPDGNLNCGLAHGVPGPLSLLSVAARAGHRSAVGDAAIGRAADWLIDHHVTDAWGVNWPDAVSLGGGPDSRYLGRTAWCYGAPGIARALWLAGQAIGEERYRAFALRAMTDAVSRPAAARGLTSVTYCHGTAGFLHIADTFARDTGLPVFDEAAGRLRDEVLAAYDPDTLLGYVNREPGERRVDQPGLLDGAPGVALALLAAVPAARTACDRLFLLG